MVKSEFETLLKMSGPYGLAKAKRMMNDRHCDVIIWMAEHVNENGVLLYTQHDISRLSGYALRSVGGAISILKRLGMLEKLGWGAYKITDGGKCHGCKGCDGAVLGECSGAGDRDVSCDKNG